MLVLSKKVISSLLFCEILVKKHVHFFDYLSIL